MTTYALTGSGTDHEVDPVSRIEGHLGVKIRVDGGVIVDANAHGNLWRGFENFLLGRDANDAITFVQRICGVCPVPHGLTSTYAVDTVLGYSRGHITFKTDAQGFGIPSKAVLIRNLVLGAEFLMSSITHFYHLAAPSYVQGPAIPPWTPYFADTQYATALLASSHGPGAVAPAGDGVVPDSDTGTMLLWDAVIISYVRALKIRRLTFEAGALFAGRMPMTSCYVGGGVTNDGTEDLTARCNKFEEIIKSVGAFVVQEYVPIALALGVLYQSFDNKYNSGLPLDPNTALPMPIRAKGYGGGLGRFLSWGAFPTLTDGLGLPGGVYDVNGDVANFKVLNKDEVILKFLGGATAVPTNLKEDITHSRYVKGVDSAVYTGNAAYPGDVSRTQPARDNGYTYMKAPRWAGFPCEVGPFARLVVAGYYPVDGDYLANVVPGYASVYTTLPTTGGVLTTPLAADVAEATALSVFKAGAVSATVAAGLTNSGLLGPVVEWIVNLKGGLSTIDRLRARALESLVLVQSMVGSITTSGAGAITWGTNGWIQELKGLTGDPGLDTASSTWTNKSIPVGIKRGWGGTEAPRGALMHQCTINNGKITKYQCIVPTTWNGSPKDSAGRNGAIEAACIGTAFASGSYDTTGGGGGRVNTTTGGVEVLRVAQSFDPCIACAIH